MSVYITDKIFVDSAALFDNKGWHSISKIACSATDYDYQINAEQAKSLFPIPPTTLVFAPCSYIVYTKLLKILEEHTENCYLLVFDLNIVPNTIRSRAIMLNNYTPNIQGNIQWIRDNEVKYPHLPLGELLLKSISSKGLSASDIWDRVILSSELYEGYEKANIRTFLDTLSNVSSYMSIKDIYTLLYTYTYFGEDLFEKSMGEIL